VKSSWEAASFHFPDVSEAQRWEGSFPARVGKAKVRNLQLSPFPDLVCSEVTFRGMPPAKLFNLTEKEEGAKVVFIKGAGWAGLLCKARGQSGGQGLPS
jgi:hypothetical protein